MIIILLLAGTLFAETHVFWYNASKNNYPITECFKVKGVNKGPCIPADAVLHEGMIVSGTMVLATSSESDYFAIGGIIRGNSSFIWSEDLNKLTGSATSAKIRGEYWDGWYGYALCKAGSWPVRTGVADFQGNINSWGGVDQVPENAEWEDFLNPFSPAMGYDLNQRTLAVEETLTLEMHQEGRGEFDNPSVLDSQFYEIDVTDQVNWILSNEGQHAIVFLVHLDDRDSGFVTLFSHEDSRDSDRTTGSFSDNPWTKDGNTMHLVVESSDLQSISNERKYGIYSENSLIGPISPNPFKPAASIPYHLGFGLKGTLQIFDLRGRLVFSRPIQGSGTVTWDASGLGSGVYLLKALSAGKTYSRKLVLQR